LKLRLSDLQRLEEQTKAGRRETESHERQTCSDPAEGTGRNRVVAVIAGTPKTDGTPAIFVLRVMGRFPFNYPP
jgi:hypothetical protein